MIVQTKLGQIKGLDQDGYLLFKGVPFAKPPVGDLRWKAPVPLEPWEGVYEADTFPPMCMQYDVKGFYEKEYFSNPEYMVSKSEDCLYLNIWTPKDIQDKSYPVVVWIHGGGFTNGFASEMEFDGEAYAKAGVILVSIQYRCGVFGFLGMDELRQEDPHGSTGNYGILDQVAALTFVNSHIKAFGGDPGNVTVMGQSAGAMSTQTLVSSQLTDGLIDKAILQSGASYDKGYNVDTSLEDACSYGHAVFEAVKEIYKIDTLDEFRQLSFDEINHASVPVQKIWREKHDLSLIYVPVIDGYVLEDGYKALIDDGRIKNIPYMIGSTKHDLTHTAELLAKGEKGLLYDGIKLFGDKINELGYISPYLYYFTHEPPGDNAGAFHSAELWYMFGTVDRSWRPMTDEDYALSQFILKLWTNFIKYGDPNGRDKQFWEAYQDESSIYEISTKSLEASQHES